MKPSNYLNLLNNIFMSPFPGQNDKFIRENLEDLKVFSSGLCKRLGVPSRTIYRGIVLDESEILLNNKVLNPLNHITYLSFSSDLNCALDFSDTKSEINMFTNGQHKKSTGFIIKHKPSSSEVLFHWSWIDKLNWSKYLENDYYKTLMNQKEVILFQNNEKFNLRDRNNFESVDSCYQKMTIF